MEGVTAVAAGVEGVRVVRGAGVRLVEGVRRGGRCVTGLGVAPGVLG